MSGSEYAPLICSVLIAKWGWSLLRVEHWKIRGRHGLTGHFAVLKVGAIKVAIGWNTKAQNRDIDGNFPPMTALSKEEWK